MTITLNSKKFPPVIILGGESNAISVARSLGRSNIKVYYMGFSEIGYSKHCTWIQINDSKKLQESWYSLLIENSNESFQGCVLLSCCDDGIEFICKYRHVLEQYYILDLSNGKVQLALLDKFKTIQLAQKVGIDTPMCWKLGNNFKIESVKESIQYPIALKPIHSHLFQRYFTQKLLIIESWTELKETYEKLKPYNLELLITEWIPGEDDQLCSFYTYIDSKGFPLFQFTKRVIRRYPPHWGLASYHITDEIPKAAQLGLKLFKGIGLSGLGNVEFKFDERDNKLKLIECNARFTAGNEALIKSGIDLPLLVYNSLLGLPLPQNKKYKSGVRLWHPIADFLSYRDLKEEKNYKLINWIKSICHKQNLPYFKWEDPLPSIMIFWSGVKKVVRRRFSSTKVFEP